MNTLLGGAAAVVSELGLVPLSDRFRHRSQGCSPFVPDRYGRVFFSLREFAVVMPSVPLNAGVNERYLSSRTLE